MGILAFKVIGFSYQSLFYKIIIHHVFGMYDNNT